jgi:hypothetical protein
MKRFIISVLSVSVFFIGLGGIMEKTSAKLKSDARALELIRLARIAIGGDANIRNVRSMTITATTTHNLEINGVAETKQGTMEINLEMPGKFNKMVRIGNPSDNAVTTEVQKQTNVFVVRKTGEAADLNVPGESKRVVIVKDGEGNVLTEDVKSVENGERRILVKKEDGTIEEIRPGDGKIVPLGEKPGEEAVFTTKDGKTIAVKKDLNFIAPGEHNIARQNEMLRTTLALLLTAPEGMDVSYTFAGETTIDGAEANIIDVDAAGSKFKLYLDKSTNLPKMISYLAAPLKVAKFEKSDAADGAAQSEFKVLVKSMDAAELVEHQLKFSDFRSVGGLLLPHRWTQTTAGGPDQTIDITNYEINPANIADKFKDQKIFVRTPKMQ